MNVTHPYQGHYMEAAFAGFVQFASRNLMDQFEAECGALSIAVSPIDRMVDAATGREASEVQRFIDWCVTQFGTPEQIGA